MAGYLDESDAQLVTAAVTKAEAETCGEIVTVLADRSDGYSDIVLAWCVLASFTAMSVFAVWPDFFLSKAEAIMGGWGFEWTAARLVTLVLTVGAVKFAALWLIQQWQPLRFFLIPGPVKTARTHDRAVKLFKVGAERRTHGRTGVLLYLSMREHRAQIVADEAIASKVPAEFWGSAMADMLEHIKQGHVAEGLAAGIRDVGLVLAEHFPRDEDDVNELPDRLIEV